MLSDAEPLLLVGAGKMGGALLDGWLQSGLDPRRVTVLDPKIEPRRAAELAQAGVRLAETASGAQGPAFRVAVLAVKPQTMSEALGAVAPLVSPETLVVSVAAGVRLPSLEASFAKGQPVARAMPNTPAQIGQGMTVAIANPHVSAPGRELLDRLLSTVGQVAWIDDEGLMNAVTAVSGSGPAYVFLLAECLAEAGREAGLPAELADILARQTVTGAGALLADSAEPPAVLRQNVTSPNGTTAAALAVLMSETGVQPLLSRAVEAARRRSVELG